MGVRLKRLGFFALVAAVTVAACRRENPNHAASGTASDQPPQSPHGTESPGSSSPGHQQMLELLAEIRERTPEENAYLGDHDARQLRAQLARLPSDITPVQEAWVHARLGIEELRLGHSDKAIEHLSTALQLSRQFPPQMRPQAQRDLSYDLGVAYLRWAEERNCLARHTSESCILPIQGGGLHVDPEGSRKAIEYFTKVLEAVHSAEPQHGEAKWLLNIAYMTLGEHPDGVPPEYRIDPKVFESDEDFPRFVNIAPQLGLDTVDLSGGAIADDFTGDGLIDIVTSTLDTGGQMRFFTNNGDGSFTERTEEAGLLGLYGGLNMIHADYNNDAQLDILVLRGGWFLGESGRHPNSLLRNNGDGTFTDVTFSAGLGDVHYPTQTAAFADFDNDGHLDLYVGNEGFGDQIPFPAQLFRNNGDGTFTDVAPGAGVQNFLYAKGVVFGDVNGDRFPDLYISNLRGDNRLYRNNRDGTFTDIAPKAGVTGPMLSFPVWFWDFDNDGSLDLFVSSYYYDYNAYLSHRLYAVVAGYLGLPHEAEPPALYRGDGKGGFVNVATEQNLTRITLPMGANFGDLTNDGYLDFYLGTGYPYYDGLMPNVMYRNRGGTGFADVTTAGGFGHLQKGHGVAFADFDNDGDLDVFEQMGGAYPGDAFGNVLYENPGFGHNWLKVRLIGVQTNRCAIGARIRAEIVDNGKRRSVYRHVNSGGSFGGNPFMQHLGLGRAERVEVLEIYWPTSDLIQTFRNVAVNQRLHVVEGAEEYEAIPEPRFTFAR